MVMLKVSALSVGDWVEYEGLHYPITFVGYGEGGDGSLVNLIRPDLSCFLCKISDIHPIPITAEMLGRNGWWRFDHQCVWNIEDNQGTSHDGEYVITWYADDGYLTISWGGREDEVLVERRIMECRVKYIHDLQHALRLAGVDKEINL